MYSRDSDRDTQVCRAHMSQATVPLVQTTVAHLRSRILEVVVFQLFLQG